jgi:TRAP-type mannitol/chloroaromatic compound transport system substrate-binding protein
MRGFGLGGRVMSRLGAQTVLVPGGKIGEAFDKHEIDGAEFLTPAVDQRQRLQDHAKIVYVPGWHQPETVLELLINQDRWNALNDEQRTVLETSCRSMLLTTLAESPRLQAAALAELAKQGVRIEAWSDDLARAFRGAWEEVASEESSRDPFFRTVLSDIEKFRAGPEPSAPTLPPMPPAP